MSPALHREAPESSARLVCTDFVRFCSSKSCADRFFIVVVVVAAAAVVIVDIVVVVVDDDDAVVAVVGGSCFASLFVIFLVYLFVTLFV